MAYLVTAPLAPPPVRAGLSGTVPTWMLGVGALFVVGGIWIVVEEYLKSKSDQERRSERRAQLQYAPAYARNRKRRAKRNPTPMHKQAQLDRKRGEKYGRDLSSWERGELMDQMVLGNVDTLYWFGKKPSAAFLNGLFDELQFLEETSL